MAPTINKTKLVATTMATSAALSAAIKKYEL
jgi:hypothetical protein